MLQHDKATPCDQAGATHTLDHVQDRRIAIRRVEQDYIIWRPKRLLQATGRPHPRPLSLLAGEGRRALTPAEGGSKASFGPSPCTRERGATRCAPPLPLRARGVGGEG